VLAGVSLTGKRVIVTGGASGLGLATVAALAKAGAKVTATVRNERSAAALRDLGGDIEARHLDLSDLHSVRTFVDGWSGPVDALVANAGVMAIPTRELTAQGWEMQLATNYLGHFALLTGLREALAAAEASRVVTVSSGAQLRAGVDLDDLHFERRAYDPWVAYSQSKSADVLLAVGVAERWADQGTTANAVAPGFIHTNIQRHVPDQTMRALGAMDEAGDLVTPDYYKTPEQGAATSVLLAGSPLVEGVTGGYFVDNQESAVVEGGPDAPSGVARWSVDPDTAARLWDRAQDALSDD
jgi:NAD(P)-dependent dehydrogenase (short-subunit alcohol dehydrogenase family)